VKEQLEREVKLAPEDGFVLPELGGEPQPTRRFTSTYHDTPDLVLARHGLTLRHRVESGAGVWQLKLPQGAARVELEQPGRPARPPLELTSLLVGFLRGRELGPVARLRTRREVVLARGAEIVDDSVSVLAGARVVHRFRELEVELVGGDERTLRKLEKELRKAGASSSEQRPKLFRALELVPADEPEAKRGDPPSGVLALALARQARTILIHDPGTRLGSEPEDLHQMRVATRRLRAFLKVAAPLLDASWSEPLREELSWLGGALGPARDLDVLVANLRDEIEALGDDAASAAGIIDVLESERASARGAVVEALSSDRYLALLDRLEHVGSPELSGQETPLPEIWAHAWKRARTKLERLDAGSTDDELHRARIRLKRVRYAAELAAPELGKAGVRFGKSAARMQDVLGVNQDATVAEERLRAWADTGEGGVGVGLLVQRELDRKAAARALRPVVWKELRRSAKRVG
jgi:CHAD domain-containing protein